MLQCSTKQRTPIWLPVALVMLLGLTPELRAAEPEPDLEDDPRALIEARHKEIQEVIASTPDEAEMQDKIRAIMDRFVDYELFAMLAGRSFWDALTPAQQEEFVTLFKGLIQRTYLRRFKANRPFSVALHGETRFNSDRDRALVSSIIESDKVAADVVYKLHLPADKSGWWAYDVDIDEVSIMRNYRTSFNRIWREGGWDDLAGRMRRRVEEDDDSDKIGELD